MNNFVSSINGLSRAGKTKCDCLIVDRADF
uniref:Uncharacterized protein n=1 Tax=Myoviridae sp. ctcFb5 TaxID=2825137 RepID=A0A8S5PXI5_9CAUD|nr:MAG TPA: hypothetical protein [Myoviridae sp. ctcFb5]